MRMGTEVIGVWILLITAGLVYASEITIGYESNTKPDFYVDELLTLTCTTSGYTQLKELKIHYKHNGVSNGCKRTGGSFQSDNTWPKFSKPTDSECFSNGDPTGFSIATEGNTRANMLNGKFMCRATTNSGDVTTSSLLIIESVKVGPQGLTMTVNNNQPVYEDTEFEFECSSENSQPVSTYRYEKYKDGELITTFTEKRYTTTESDRGGFMIKCIDESHPNWVRVEDIIKESALIEPHYIAIAGRDGITRERTIDPLNPRPLACDVIGTPDPEYSWTRDGGIITELSNTLLMSPGSASDGDIENIRCTATVEGIDETISIAWLVTWDSTASADPATPRPVPGNPDGGNPDGGNPNGGNPSGENPNTGNPDTGNPDTHSGGPDVSTSVDLLRSTTPLDTLSTEAEKSSKLAKSISDAPVTVIGPAVAAVALLATLALVAYWKATPDPRRRRQDPMADFDNVSEFSKSSRHKKRSHKSKRGSRTDGKIKSNGRSRHKRSKKSGLL